MVSPKNPLPPSKIPEEENKENKKYIRVPVYTKKDGNTVNQLKQQTVDNKKSFIKVFSGCLVSLGIMFGGILLLASLPSIFSESPEQKALKKAQVLNEWFNSGSDISCERHLKEQLRDPNSYERDGDFTTPTDNGKEKIITWKFRSKNGFGGLTNSIGMCLVKKDGKYKATVLGQ
jgi:hypothetical protein